jgi:hypothetical protein
MSSLPSILSFAAKRKLSSGLRLFQDSTLNYRCQKSTLCLKKYDSVIASGLSSSFHTSSGLKSNQDNEPPKDSEKSTSLIKNEPEEKKIDVKVNLK